jgi:hypothetical protein
MNRALQAAENEKMAVLTPRQETARSLAYEIDKAGGVVVNPMPLHPDGRLRFQVVDASRPGVLQVLSDLGFVPAFCGMTFRICVDGTFRPASIFEIDLPRERQPIPDDRVHGELASSASKPSYETEQLMRYLGWPPSQKQKR